MPRERTIDETREIIFRAIAARAVDCIRGSKTKEEAVISALFGCFSILEGSRLESPHCLLLSRPHSDDKEYHKKQGEDWFPRADVSADVAEKSILRGEDHHLFIQLLKEMLEDNQSKKANKGGLPWGKIAG